MSPFRKSVDSHYYRDLSQQHLVLVPITFSEHLSFLLALSFVNSMLVPPSHGQNRGGYLLSVIWSQFAISFCFVALRFYCRIRLTRNAWWDDWCCLFAFVGHSPNFLFWGYLMTLPRSASSPSHPSSRSTLRMAEPPTAGTCSQRKSLN